MKLFTSFKLCIITILTIFIIISCESGPEKLPILGNPTTIDGETVPHQIPEFSFVNQDGEVIDNEFYDDKMYVATFFFTYCPTICPVVSRQMLRIYDEYEHEDELYLLSHTLDPKKDSIQALKEYSMNLGVTAPKWNFVTGSKKEIRDIVDDYFNIVVDDDTAPGGINHSGKIVLVDKDGHIRSFCEGTDPDEVTEFMKDIDKLLNEYKEK